MKATLSFIPAAAVCIGNAFLHPITGEHFNVKSVSRNDDTGKMTFQTDGAEFTMGGDSVVRLAVPICVESNYTQHDGLSDSVILLLRMLENANAAGGVFEDLETGDYWLNESSKIDWPDHVSDLMETYRFLKDSLEIPYACLIIERG